jgi:hypothetical protein
MNIISPPHRKWHAGLSGDRPRLQMRADGRWEDVQQLPPDAVDQFIVYCQMHGYLTATKDHAAATFRYRGQYFRVTNGAITLILAGAAPDTPVPPALREVTA